MTLDDPVQSLEDVESNRDEPYGSVQSLQHETEEKKDTVEKFEGITSGFKTFEYIWFDLVGKTRGLVSDATQDLRNKTAANEANIDSLNKEKQGLIERVGMLEKIVLNKEADTKFDIFEDITARLVKLEGLPE